MNVTWLGQNCIKLEGKNASIVIDPIDGKAGAMPKLSTDILVLSRVTSEKDINFLKNEPFVIKTPGEFESKEIFVRTIAAGEHGDLITRCEVDGLRIGHLGSLKATDDVIEGFLENIDILFIPTGGGEVLSPDTAAEVVSSVEPRIVIPMHYRTPKTSGLQPVEKFCQAMGMKAPDAQTKVSLSTKDLPNEETRLIILE